MKYVCTSCGMVYGEGPNTKPKFGFCTGCWNFHLAMMKLNWEKTLFKERQRLVAEGLERGEEVRYK